MWRFAIIFRIISIPGFKQKISPFPQKVSLGKGLGSIKALSVVAAAFGACAGGLIAFDGGGGAFHVGFEASETI